eukprot:6777272-Pyramimonas_sp.AAC.2
MPILALRTGCGGKNGWKGSTGDANDSPYGHPYAQSCKYTTREIRTWVPSCKDVYVYISSLAASAVAGRVVSVKGRKLQELICARSLHLPSDNGGLYT